MSFLIFGGVSGNVQPAAPGSSRLNVSLSDIMRLFETIAAFAVTAAVTSRFTLWADFMRTFKGRF